MNTYGNQKIEHDNAAALKELFVGRKVVDLDEESETIMLDNGVRVRVIPNEGCGGCPDGHYELKALNMLKNVDHVITAAKVVAIGHPSEDNGWSSDTTYQLAVYAAGVGVKKGKRTNLVEITGNDGNGYYGTGFTLEVIEA